MIKLLMTDRHASGGLHIDDGQATRSDALDDAEPDFNDYDPRGR